MSQKTVKHLKISYLKTNTDGRNGAGNDKPENRFLKDLAKTPKFEKSEPTLATRQQNNKNSNLPETRMFSAVHKK